MRFANSVNGHIRRVSHSSFIICTNSPAERYFAERARIWCKLYNTLNNFRSVVNWYLDIGRFAAYLHKMIFSLKMIFLILPFCLLTHMYADDALLISLRRSFCSVYY